MKSIRTAVAVPFIIATAMIGTAGAQDQPPKQSPGMMGSGFMGPDAGYGFMGPWMMGSGVSGETTCSAMAGHIEGRLAYIKAELKITETQESLWNTFSATARDNANTMFAHCTTIMSRRGGPTVSLLDRLDQNEQLMAAQLDALRAINKAVRPLYAALSDGQKKNADQLFWGPMGIM